MQFSQPTGATGPYRDGVTKCNVCVVCCSESSNRERKAEHRLQLVTTDFKSRNPAVFCLRRGIKTYGEPFICVK